MTYGDNNILTRMFAILGRSRFTPKRLAKIESINSADAGMKKNPVIKTAGMQKKAALAAAIGRGAAKYMKKSITDKNLLIPVGLGLVMGGARGAVELGTDELKVGPGTIGDYKKIREQNSFRKHVPMMNSLAKAKQQNQNIPNL